MKLSIKTLFVAWILVLVLINVIPIGNDNSSILGGNKILELRLDYLIHIAMILCFGWIWLKGQLKGRSFFAKQEKLRYILVVLSSAIILELIQLIIPWRAFNPVDMFYNLVGAALCVLVVVTSKKSPQA